jgi:Kef-type K+ transport system membrane component KefB
MSVVFELLAGLALGNLHLAGVTALDFLKTSRSVDILAEVAVVLLFFRVGLESTVDDMRRVGATAFLVAAAGVAGSFLCGLLVVRLLLSSTSLAAQIFLAASLTATSVGVTARVLKDLRQTRTGTAHVILGAAVVDDVIALTALGVLGFSGIIPMSVNGSAFLVIAAFIAGLLIDERRSQAIDRVLEPVARLVVPIFFVATGLHAELSGLARPGVVVLAAGLTVAAIVGKQFCALAARRERGGHVDPTAVAIGMMPRGEVTLIFASIGLSGSPYLAVVIAVIVTTLVTPFALRWRLSTARSRS